MRSWKPVIVSRFRTRLIRIADGDVSRSSSEGGRRPPGGSIIPFPLLFQGHLNRANQIKVAMVVPFSLFLLLLLSFPLSLSLSLSLSYSLHQFIIRHGTTPALISIRIKNVVSCSQKPFIDMRQLILLRSAFHLPTYSNYY